MTVSLRRAFAAVALMALALPAMAGEAEVRRAVSGLMGADGKIASVQKTPFASLFEVVLESGEIVYVESNGAYMLSGTLIDVRGRRNLTAAREAELNRINVADLPLDQAIKQVRGKGTRVLVTFEDPNCSFCKKLARDLKELKDSTIYTFMIPILSPDSLDKGRNIWCAKDKAEAWNDWMVDGKAPATANCDAPIQKNGDMARKYRITGTPTMFLADGSRIGGYVPPAELDRAMNEAESRARK